MMINQKLEWRTHEKNLSILNYFIIVDVFESYIEHCFYNICISKFPAVPNFHWKQRGKNYADINFYRLIWNSKYFVM